MIATRSASREITESWWEMKIIVRPRSRRISSSSAKSCAWIETSSALTASSAISSRGSTASERAIATRWRWPPENSCG